MIRTIIFTLVGCLFSCSIQAATYVLKNVPNSLDDWKNPDNYVGNAAPQGASEDIIVLPENSTVALDATDAHLVAFVSGLKSIYVSNTVFSVSVPQGNTVELNCSITDNNSLSGTLEKLGNGELKLTAWRRLNSCNSPTDYARNILVREGTLRLPDTSHSEAITYYNMYGIIKVDAGAKLISITKSIWQIRGIVGAGMITNESSTACTVYVTKHWSKKEPFTGTLGGYFDIQLRSDAYLELAGSSSTFSKPDFSCALSGSQASPSLFISKFGDAKEEASSIGRGNALATFSSGMRIVYTGEGETTHKTIYALNYPAYIDAGANGGVVFAGDFATWSTSIGNIQRHLVLDGSNRNECVISGKFDPAGNCVQNGATNHWYISKRGSGVWRFTADDHKHLVGTFAVENGVLAFDSIYQKGVDSALGTSSRTYWYHTGAIDENKHSEYAFELGCATNSDWTGLMEYRGDKAAQCLDRKFALVGNGGFKADAGAGVIRYANLKGVGTGAKKLVLDGNSTLNNSLYNVSDGDGVISLCKRGGGVWALGGEVDISGDLEVLGGKLIVRRAPQRYSHYRFVLKEIAAENPDLYKYYNSDPNNPVWTQTYGFFCFNEIALYDKDGYRQNFYLSACENRAELAPGQAAFATDKTVIPNENGMSIAYLFDGIRKVVLEDGKEVWNGFVGSIDAYNQPNRNREDSYVAIDMYLPLTANAITHYDVANSGIHRTSTAGGRTASAFALYGSVDGVNYDLLSEDEFDEITEVPAGTYYWLYRPKSYNDTSDPNPATVHTDGWRLAKTVPDRVFNVLDNLGSVTIANGAELEFEGEDAPEISKLKLDVNAQGSIKGFAFAAEGCLEIAGELPKEGATISLDLNEAENAANLSSWSVKVNGEITGKKLRAGKNGLEVYNRGLILKVL